MSVLSDAAIDQRHNVIVDQVTAGAIAEVEVAWSDQFGHPLGKRVPVDQFLQRAQAGFNFCDGALAWNASARVIESLQLTNWNTGYPDVFAVPDLDTFRELPWRPGVGHVISDIVTHDRTPSRLDPRGVLRRVIERLGALGYTAKVGAEFEFYLLDPDGSIFQDDVHTYSLQNANSLEPLLSELYSVLRSFTSLEGLLTEYGPGQVEANLVYSDALDAADNSARLKYAVKEVARRNGKLATFMPKPFAEYSGSSAHLHISLWRDGEPVFAGADGTESQVGLQAIAGLLEHLPSITLFGAHSVNAYRRYARGSFAPATVAWGRDNRTSSIRSLLESTPEASRIELRTGASDANPYWLIASALAAIVAGLEAKRHPPEPLTGNLYDVGVRLPESLGVAIALARSDDAILDILGADSVHDFAEIAQSEWDEYSSAVSDWEFQRYLANS
ncbi:glutamine synthetase [Mycobacterium sp. CBMA293]|uniref:glutamine synthetase family protein n=1 Tax=unclassified Mycolicibacterium TaxID=2636767 RepID=UPI0012DCB80A|nr:MULTISPECIES: glutamine synthetase family protein [unclassified Mycolicibacterium]MUL47213.1 glutamine synthetase [Mycolicibacterium sp. CBMA 360]MUL61322.1 glutamine synthetase [Mycolicibacterium sp. CBMA 335]MUL72057.1 glutamine synthetase [Mycolicibacterium sp. CBMA 311]MUL96224.1 glutamine synthetase [Mycolicibacterium sp. CBMA 230]MUM08952.1 glutamine synthetase [Mycolicibacterium sp. CBMA 213]